TAELLVVVMAHGGGDAMRAVRGLILSECAEVVARASFEVERAVDPVVEIIHAEGQRLRARYAPIRLERGVSAFAVEVRCEDSGIVRDRVVEEIVLIVAAAADEQ